MLLSGLTRFPRSVWLVMVALMVGADQATKSYFSNAIALGSGVEVSGWLNLVHVLNTGAAFSFLADAGGWQRFFLIAVSALVVVAISYACLMNLANPYERWVGAGVVAGGVGNLIDRIQTGAVVDFLDLHWNGLHWPAFNLADIFVVSAALGWGLLTLRTSTQASPRHSTRETNA